MGCCLGKLPLFTGTQGGSGDEVMRGWLEKKGSGKGITGRRNWKKRWFVHHIARKSLTELCAGMLLFVYDPSSVSLAGLDAKGPRCQSVFFFFQHR
jgi:hypothetical protein